MTANKFCSIFMIIFFSLSILITDGQLQAQTKDADDLPTGAVQITVPHSGNYDISVDGDVDWYRLDLTSGTEYVFNVSAAPLDAYIYLYGPGNADGTLTGDEVAFDDETNAPDPEITYTPVSSGYFYLRVAEYGYKKATGGYLLEVSSSSAPSGFVTVTSPNGNEEWELGSVQAVTWDYDISDMVKIDLYNGIVFVDELAITSCTGSYDWTIDTLLTPGTDYKVKITSTVDPLVLDESDLSFTIIEQSDGNNLPTEATVLSVPHTGNYDIYADGDLDWYRIELIADSVYNISVSNSTIDTHMNLFGPGNETGTSTGVEIAADDDTNGWDPEIEYTPVTTGYYYLRVAEFSYKSDKGTGNYTLSVKELDMNPPEIISTSPITDAVDVSASSNITVYFSEKMDGSSINDASFTLFEGTNQIAGAVSYIDSVATFDPDANLVYSTVYTATVTTAVTDRSEEHT
ncbi:MAG: Ig-like domain-containing protein, partial [Lachnospiraceae bacterium]|nr:Ig-like domain-containing protein [Lachnospiraceae bacterium]